MFKYVLVMVLMLAGAITINSGSPVGWVFIVIGVVLVPVLVTGQINVTRNKANLVGPHWLSIVYFSVAAVCLYFYFADSRLLYLFLGLALIVESVYSFKTQPANALSPGISQQILEDEQAESLAEYRFLRYLSKGLLAIGLVGLYLQKS